MSLLLKIALTAGVGGERVDAVALRRGSIRWRFVTGHPAGSSTLPGL
jgi:hypothetical protein